MLEEKLNPEPEISAKIYTVDAKVVDDIKNESGGDTGKYHSAIVLPDP